MSSGKLERDIGQMIAVGAHGESLRSDFFQAMIPQIERGYVTGIPLFYYNILSRPQITAFVREIKGIQSPDPLLIMADMEGGKVQRFKAENGFLDFPTPRLVAEGASPAKAHAVYSELAGVLVEIGVNFNFAPVVDINGEPPCEVIGGLERSFGSTAEAVTTYARTFIDAHRNVGVLTTIKHFPGHGSAQGDTHKGIPDITEVWSEKEIEPFASLVKSGHADAVLTSHLLHRGVDPEWPVTLSKTWVSRLRNELKFDGVIMTDCLHMGAMQLSYGFEEVVVRSVIAGHDILLFSNNPKAAKGVEGFAPDPMLPEKIVAIILKAIDDGRINRAQIEASASRIRKMKGRLRIG